MALISKPLVEHLSLENWRFKGQRTFPVMKVPKPARSDSQIWGPDLASLSTSPALASYGRQGVELSQIPPTFKLCC